MNLIRMKALKCNDAVPVGGCCPALPAARRAWRAWLIALAALLIGANPPAGARAGSIAGSPDAGFLVVAPDRGFQGNEETRDAFEIFSAGRNAALAYITDERTRETLNAGLATLTKNGARRIVVLPLFVSAADARMQLAQGLLEDITRPAGASRFAGTPLLFAPPFGESYLAVEALADRFRAIKDRAGRRVIVAGYGAGDGESREQIEADWGRIAQKAAEGFGFGSVSTVVWHDRSVPQRESKWKQAAQALARAAGDGAIVVPFHFGSKLDGMMSFNAYLARVTPRGSVLVTDEAASPPVLAMWMEREARRRSALGLEDLGVVLLAHGSDYHWNETMRQSVRALEQQYKIEYCFSMADQRLVDRAVRRLEARGAKAIVIVRVFGLESSHRSDVERMIGADVERALAAAGDQPHQEHESSAPAGVGHGRGDSGATPARIRSAAPMTTVGGVEANSHFAAALLDRARELSREPRSETVILIAHGSGDEATNEHWLQLLDKLAAQMRANGGAEYRAIRFATWREDWPNKRGPWIAKVQAMVKEASADGGRALVIPARVTARGPERTYLSGLIFELGSGFAPHPLFARWFEEKIKAGGAKLGLGEAPPAVASSDRSHVH